MSRGNQIKWEFTAQDRGQHAAWERSKRDAEQMAEAVEGIGEAGRETGDSLEDSFTRAGTRLQTMRDGLQTVAQSIREMADEQRAFDDATVESQVRMSDALGALGVQMGRRVTAGEEQTLGDVSRQFAVDPTRVVSGTQQLVSSGFSSGAAVSATDELIAGLVATNAAGRGGSIADLTRSSAAFLSATGQDLNQENLGRLMMQQQGLFQGTNFQTRDLQGLSTAAAGLGGLGLSPEDMLAFQAAGSMNIPEGGQVTTGLRNFFARISGVREGTVQSSALGRLGTTSAELTAMSPEERLSAIGGGAQGLGADIQNQVFRDLFGVEGMSFARMITSQETLGAIGDIRGRMGSADTFNQAVGIATSTRGAQRRRSEINLELARAGTEVEFSDAERDEAMETIQRQEGTGPFARFLERRSRNISNLLRVFADEETVEALGGGQTERRYREFLEQGSQPATRVNEISEGVKQGIREASRENAGSGESTLGAVQRQSNPTVQP